MPPRTPQRSTSPQRPTGPYGSNDLSHRLIRLLRPGNLSNIAIAILVALALFGLLPPGEIRGSAEAVDGDSLLMSGDRVRLYAIDAPELHQPCRSGDACGERAHEHLAKLIAGHDLLCEKRDTDRYGRDVAQCYVMETGQDGKSVKGTDIGRAMVRAVRPWPTGDRSGLCPQTSRRGSISSRHGIGVKAIKRDKRRTTDQEIRHVEPHHRDDRRALRLSAAVSLREPPVLRRLREFTQRRPHAGMQISPEQGQFMALLVEMIGAKRAHRGRHLHRLQRALRGARPARRAAH